MGRKLRTRVPCHPSDLLPSTPDPVLVRKREKAYRADMKSNYDRRHRVKEAGDLSAGDKVWLPDLKTEGKIVGKAGGPRSYVISTPTGLVRRNRRMTRNAGLPPVVELIPGPVTTRPVPAVNPPTPRCDTPKKSCCRYMLCTPDTPSVSKEM